MWFLFSGWTARDFALDEVSVACSVCSAASILTYDVHKYHPAIRIVGVKRFYVDHSVFVTIRRDTDRICLDVPVCRCEADAEDLIVGDIGYLTFH